MSPVVGQDGLKEHRRKGRRSLLLLLVLPILLLAMLLVPGVRPVVLHWGDRWLLVGTDHQPGRPTGFGAHDLPAGVLMVGPEGECWQLTGQQHAWWLSLGGWIYWASWFRGRRIR